jgi:hypothetical protein
LLQGETEWALVVGVEGEGVIIRFEAAVVVAAESEAAEDFG